MSEELTSNAMTGRCRRLIAGLACLGAFAAEPGLATDVCGPITVDTTWTLAGSPYVVTCNVVVFGGATLTIEPGVEVRFRPATRLSAQDGTIAALGTGGVRITFRSDDPQSKGIGVRLRAAFGAVGEFENCDFYDLEQAIHVTDGGNDGELTITGCRFFNNDYAVRPWQMGTDTAIVDSYFEDNTYAVEGERCRLDDCAFLGNSFGVGPGAYDVDVIGSSFQDHLVAIDLAWGLIEGCTISDNDTAVRDPGYLTGPDVKDNAITGNDIGVDGFAELTGNTITGNRIGVTIPSWDFGPFECNDIFDNTDYSVVMETDVSLLVPDNWWGALDLDEIEATVYDGFDDPNLGYFAFWPYLRTAAGESHYCACRGSWTQVATLGPSARDRHAMAYDSLRGRTVLFGGSDGYGYLADTWEWDGVIWTEIQAPGPSGRWDSAMAYDSARGVTVLFGGYTGGYSGATWEWDGATWTEIQVPGPDSRHEHAMAYDSGRGVTVLFGGYGYDGYKNDTWEWDGTTWTEVEVTGPGYRRGHAMAYDSARGVTVLFGGYDGTGQNDTWEWDGTAWTEVQSPGPGYYWEHALVYDASRAVTVLFADAEGSTWEWDGTTWTEIQAPGPAGYRRRHAMAYDSARGVTVLFGGSDGTRQNDTWEWDGPPAAPSITQQPDDVLVPVGQPAIFAVIAEHPYETLTYQWRRDAVPLADDGRITGTTTPTLTINPVRMSDAGDYDVVVSVFCGGVTSNLVTLTVSTDPGDLNCDGVINAGDIPAFVVALTATPPDFPEYYSQYPNCDRELGDVNDDGAFNSGDIPAFIELLTGGG